MATLKGIFDDTVYGAKNDAYTFDVLGRNKFGKPAELKPTASPRDSFYAMIEQWAFSLPVQSEWLLYIDDIPNPVCQAFLEKFESAHYSTRGDRNIDLDKVINKFQTTIASGGHANIMTQLGQSGKKPKNIFERISDRADEVGNLFNGKTSIGEFIGRDQKYTSGAGTSLFGCRFAESVGGLPSEKANVSYTQVPIPGGYLGAYAGAPRGGYSMLNISFKESNTSFPDFVIRPWIQRIAHEGLIAPKNPKQKLTTTLQIIQYGRSVNKKMTPARKQWIFFNACPVSIDEETLDFSDMSSWPTKSTQWIFTNYVVLNYDQNDDIMKYQTPRGPSWFERFVPGSVSNAVGVFTGDANSVTDAIGSASPI